MALALLVAGCGNTLTQVSMRARQDLEAHRAYSAGVNRYAANDYAAAIPCFERALALEPTFDDAEAYLAWSYYSVGNYRDSTRHFRRTLARQPRWEGLYNGLGWSRYRLQRYHIAAEAFRQALDLKPQYREATVGLAYAYFESGRYSEAFPLLERLTREGEGSALQSAAPDVEEVRARFAWTLYYLGRTADAQREFLRALAAHPEWYGLHNGLGWTYLALKDSARARRSFQNALALHPGYADAQEGLAQARR